jgi:hypothetical protein
VCCVNAHLSLSAYSCRDNEEQDRLDKAAEEEWERRTKPYNSELDIGLPLRNRRLELFRAAALANDEDTVISLVALDPGKVSYMYPIRIHGLHLYYSILRTYLY